METLLNVEKFENVMLKIVSEFLFHCLQSF